jgi:hypothetical protein
MGDEEKEKRALAEHIAAHWEALHHYPEDCPTEDDDECIFCTYEVPDADDKQKVVCAALATFKLL